MPSVTWIIASHALPYLLNGGREYCIVTDSDKIEARLKFVDFIKDTNDVVRCTKIQSKHREIRKERCGGFHSE